MKFPEKYRIQHESNTEYNAFLVNRKNFTFLIIANDDEAGWEHVSVSLKHRCPNWNEMCFVKDLFWNEDECVVQFHPPKSDYVNIHPYCLHLWKQKEGVISMPSIFRFIPPTHNL